MALTSCSRRDLTIIIETLVSIVSDTRPRRKLLALTSPNRKCINIIIETIVRRMLYGID